MVLLACGIATADPATRPSFEEQLQQVAVKSAAVTSLSADFEQRKFTPMLKKPLTSSGTVLAKGSSALWLTKKPDPSAMLLTDRELRIYYPKQQSVELYSLQGQIGSLAASPLPKLTELRKLFSITPADGSDGDTLACLLKPTDAELSTHVKQVTVLLDRATGIVRRIETVTTDGDRTVMSLTDAKPNAELTDADLKLDVPVGTKQSRPLAGMEGRP